MGNLIRQVPRFLRKKNKKIVREYSIFFSTIFECYVNFQYHAAFHIEIGWLS